MIYSYQTGCNDVYNGFGIFVPRRFFVRLLHSSNNNKNNKINNNNNNNNNVIDIRSHTLLLFKRKIRRVIDT